MAERRPTPEEVAARVVAAGGRARFAGRVAVGVYGDGDVPSWSAVVDARSRARVRRLALLAAAMGAPTVAALLLLPQLALATQVSLLTAGVAVLVPVAAAVLVVVPAATLGSGRSRSRVAVLAASLVPLAGIAAAFVTNAVLLAVVAALAACAALVASACAHAVLVDAVVPEARARALGRWWRGWVGGATLGAAAAALATAGPAVGAGAALVGAGAVALLLVLLAAGVGEPGAGGVEVARMRELFGWGAVEVLTTPAPGTAALGRVARTPAARTSLTGYVAVGAALVGVVPVAYDVLVVRDTGAWPFELASPGRVAAALGLALLVVAVLAAGLAHAAERARRRSPREGARGAVVGLLLAAAGIVVVAAAPAAVVPAGVALCGIGAVLAGVSLDGVVASVVAPPDRAAAFALATFSLGAGAALGYVVPATLAEASSAGVGLGVTAALVALGALACVRTVRLATDGLDAMVGAEAEESVLEELAGADAVVPVLSAQSVSFSYGSVQALYGVTLSVRPGELVALLGPNGVGKTTLLRVLSGLESPSSGIVRIEGHDVTSVKAPGRVALGLSQITGGSAVFGSMTIEENLRMYGFSLGRDKQAVDAGIARAYDAFPRLADRRTQLASTLSGGEQQMLGLAKALMLAPKVLLIDEFSLGLAPVIVGELMATVRRLNAAGTAVLLVEQSVNVALSLVERVYFMEKGRITYSGSAEELRADPELVAALSMGGAHAEDLAHDEHEEPAATGPVGVGG